MSCYCQWCCTACCCGVHCSVWLTLTPTTLDYWISVDHSMDQAWAADHRFTLMLLSALFRDVYMYLF